MDLNIFIEQQKIREADAIVVKKEAFRLLNHYVIYLGKDSNGEHQFIANTTKGVRILTKKEKGEFGSAFVPHKINRFIGPENKRKEAVARALSKMDENSYHLIINNCEHFATLVQTGKAHSEQVATLGKSLTVAGSGAALLGAAKKNKGVAVLGLVTLALGLIVLNASEQ